MWLIHQYPHALVPADISYEQVKNVQLVHVLYSGGLGSRSLFVHTSSGAIVDDSLGNTHAALDVALRFKSWVNRITARDEE